MPRVLIVTSMFVPYFGSDMHRARVLASELPQLGWEVEILAPGDEFQLSEHHEPDAVALAVDVPVHKAAPEWAHIFRLLTSRTLGWRAYRPLRRLGDRLLASGRFDLIYFSCSQSLLFHLGVGWHRRHAVPFIVDLQDPWYVPTLPETDHHPRFKRHVGNLVARYTERATLRSAAGLVSVSPSYLAILSDRYRGANWPSLQGKHQLICPFGPAERDFIAVGWQYPDRHVPDSSVRTIAYVGTGGPIMEHSFRHVCRLLAETARRLPGSMAGLRVELIGTEPDSGTRALTLSRVAAEEGLSGLVTEHPDRLSYVQALRRVANADGLLILGVDDPAYCPSKLFLHAMSGKPMLACMREGSVVDAHFISSPTLGQIVHFSAEGRPVNTSELLTFGSYLNSVRVKDVVDRLQILKPHSARTMAERHVELFEACVRMSCANAVAGAPAIL